MFYTLDITAQGFSLANAKQCALAARDAYNPLAPLASSAAVQVVSPMDGTQVLITDCGNCLLVAFEGSKNIRQFLTDAKAWWKKFQGYSIHDGFFLGARALEPLLFSEIFKFPFKPIVLCGHSLGGDLAEVFGYRLGEVAKLPVCGVYTFGAARLVNALGVTTYGDRAKIVYRLVNGTDIVPWMPGYWLGYRHVGTEYFLPSEGGIINGPALWMELWKDIPELIREWRRKEAALLTDHFIQSYIDRMDRL